jgi:hypothetical protein
MGWVSSAAIIADQLKRLEIIGEEVRGKRLEARDE